MFETHILGSPTIVCMDAEVNKYILMNESKGFVPGYPKAMHNILGQNNICAVHGSPHKILRGSLLSLISPIMIKESLLPRIDNVIRYLVDGLNGKTIDIQEKTEEVSTLRSFLMVKSLSYFCVSYIQFLTIVILFFISRWHTWYPLAKYFVILNQVLHYIMYSSQSLIS